MDGAAARSHPKTRGGSTLVLVKIRVEWYRSVQKKKSLSSEFLLRKYLAVTTNQNTHGIRLLFL